MKAVYLFMLNNKQLLDSSYVFNWALVMFRYISGIIIFIFSYASAQAEENTGSDILTELEQDIKRYSDLATNTNQNVDYMPYVISTLHNEDLVALGVLNLREAVSLIPGVDLNVGMAGIKNPIFRGSNPYAFGQSRLIIDGMEVNDQIFGGYNQLLDLPVDIIHRIEVVRGPGSMLTHVNGFAGSIHVITKANRDDGQEVVDNVFAVLGSDKQAGAGIIKSFDFAGGKFSSDLYYQKNDLSLEVGDDRFGNSGETDQSLKNYQLGLNFERGGLYFKARLSKNESGVSYGQAFSLTDDESDYLEVENNTFELKYIKALSNKANIEFALNYFDENRDLQNKVMPDGAMLMMPPPPTLLTEGRYFLVDYSEQTFSQRLQFNFDFSSSHKFQVGVQARQAKINDNNAAVSDDGLQSSSEFSLFTNEKRDINIVYFEDMFEVGEKTTVQIGGKLSQYSDVDDQSALRLAVVHRYNDKNIYKAMYSQAYREPSWREQYLSAPAFFLPNTDLDPETVDAYEMSYIRRLGHRDFFKINAFYLENKSQIDAQNQNRRFDNSEENNLYGFEFEYEIDIFSRDVLHVNYSYLDGDNVTGELANSAQTLIDVYYLYRLNNKWNFSGLVEYVGDKGRIETDTRDDVDQYGLLDLSAGYKGNEKSVKFTFTVKNVFDKEYSLPSPANTYPEDFPQSGRTWMVRVSKEF